MDIFKNLTTYIDVTPFLLEIKKLEQGEQKEIEVAVDKFELELQ